MSRCRKSPSRRALLQWTAVGAGSALVPELWAASARGTRPDPLPGDREVVTTCNQCFLGCGLIATVRDDRLLHLRGNPDSPTNRGRVCPKAHAGVAKLYHPERVGYPLVRVGKRGEGRFRRASWEEALGLVADQLHTIMDTYGGRSVALWQNVDHERPAIFERFVHALGSPNYFDHPGSISPALAAGLAVGPVYLLPDYAHAETILIVGANPLGTKELCWSARELLDAKHRGATLICVDPRLSETGMHATPGFWLPIRPGTDGLLLAGLANALIQRDAYDHAYVRAHTYGFDQVRDWLRTFEVDAVCERIGLPRQQFERVLDAMIGKRTVVDAFSGLSFQPDGTRAGQLRIVLAALLGGIDTPGGLLPLSVPRVALGEVEPQVPAPSIERIDRGNMGRIPLPFGRRPTRLSFTGIAQDLPRAILEGQPYPLRALFFCYTNPVYSVPRSARLIEALEALDLVVCIDAFLSETALYADVVLPGATYLETTELNDVFPPFEGVALRQPVVAPRMESRSTQDIVIQLAHALGLQEQFPFPDYETFLELQLEDSALDLAELREKGFQELGYVTGQRLEAGLETPSGRIELYPSVLDYSGIAPFPDFARWEEPEPPSDFPLHLVSYRVPHHANSRTASNPYLAAIQSENALLLNPLTAAELGLGTGDQAVLTSSDGELTVRVRLTQGIRPDTVALSHHFGHWAYAQACRGRGAWFNQVASSALDPISFNPNPNTFVRLRRA